ncbi:uncharacterized protein [Magallana gigas]|uniref:uncharacterized protein n=1 Tax=Magallana gigas TaxID=29159 RepID=UPI0033409C18
MALFVFNWTKRGYIMAVLCLVLLVLAAQHREYFLCEEKHLSSFEKFCVWLGVMEKPKPCPGIEDMYSMAMEMGQASVAVVASSFIPSVLKWTCSLLGSGVRLIKRIPKAIKGSIQLIKGIPRFFKGSLSSAKGIPQSMKGIPKSVKKSAWIIKDRMRFGRRSLGASKKDPPKYKYFFFRNAYNQRKVAMFVREGEKYKEIFVQNPRTKKMECILSYPKEA